MSDELPPAIMAELARADVWVIPPDGLEDAIVTSIGSQPVPIASRRQRNAQRRVPTWLTAAAAIAIIAGGAAAIAAVAEDDGTDDVTTEAALVGTDLAPGASASAQFTPTPAGLKILLDADRLAGAGPDEMYEAWISDGTVRVSAGTFHLREGDEPIELWAGTDDPRFRTITVTIEPIDGVAESSGRVVLKGEFDLAHDEATAAQYTGD